MAKIGPVIESELLRRDQPMAKRGKDVLLIKKKKKDDYAGVTKRRISFARKGQISGEGRSVGKKVFSVATIPTDNIMHLTGLIPEGAEGSRGCNREGSLRG